MKKEDVIAVFEKYRAMFSVYFPVADSRLLFHAKHPEVDEYRAVAWAIKEKKTVNLLNRALELDKETIIGLIIHEIGHLCDPFVESEGREQRADDLAELITGHRISYTKPHLLQTICLGIYPRPQTLHQ